MASPMVYILPGQWMRADRIVAVAVEGRVVTVAYDEPGEVQVRRATFDSNESASDHARFLVHSLNCEELP